jgi:hypothetical protein
MSNKTYPQIGDWTSGPIITPDGGGIKPIVTPNHTDSPTGTITTPSADAPTSGSVGPVPPADPYADAIIEN